MWVSPSFIHSLSWGHWVLVQSPFDLFHPFLVFSTCFWFAVHLLVRPSAFFLLAHHGWGQREHHSRRDQEWNCWSGIYAHTLSTSLLFSQFFSLINSCLEGSVKEYQRKTVSFLCLLWWVACGIMNEWNKMFVFGRLQSLMLPYQKKKTCSYLAFISWMESQHACLDFRWES